MTTHYAVDFDDGFRAEYINLTARGDAVYHQYHRWGVYRVSVEAKNSAGADQTELLLSVCRAYNHYALPDYSFYTPDQIGSFTPYRAHLLFLHI